MLQAPLGPKTFILGEPVLRKYYTVYVLIFKVRAMKSSEDWAARRIGFAQADHSQDGEVQGAIGSPEAEFEVHAVPLAGGLFGGGCAFEQERRRR